MSVRAVIYLRVSSAQQVERDNTEEGYSIPAQREDCLRLLERKGWDFAGEYVDAGESARSADRPELQRMLRDIKSDPTIKAVVVHKIDRLARNLSDYAAIRALLDGAGVQTISVSEGFGDGPSGRLTAGILATFAEFYSANLAEEIKVKKLQKIKMGGWPNRAPIGYLNHRERAGKRSLATIIVDADRAPLIVEGFERYAEGDLSVKQLSQIMDERGLKTANGNPVGPMRWLEILRNVFYIGQISWNGEIYDGAHEPIVAPDLFLRVQRVLEVRNYAGTRDRRHFHYLKGTLRCGECGKPLSFSRSKGRPGRYDYFYCLGRGNCSQPYVPTDLAEREVERLYRGIALPTETAEMLIEGVRETIGELHGAEERERVRLTRRLERLNHERGKLFQVLYDDDWPAELISKEQHRISTEIKDVTAQLERIGNVLESAQRAIEDGLQLVSLQAGRYTRYSPETRRKFNKAIFGAIYFEERRVARYEYTELIAPLMQTATSLGGGSIRDTVVERTGIEPVTSGLQSQSHD